MLKLITWLLLLPLSLAKDDDDNTFVSPYNDDELKSLVHNQDADCVPANDSTRWSCIKYIPQQEYQQRLDGGIKYGFQTKEEAGPRNVGDTMDRTYDDVIPKIPRLTRGPGFLKMDFTDEMKRVVLPFYKHHKQGGIKDASQNHAIIPGQYTNSHVVTMKKISLDQFPNIHAIIRTEMERILTWWTGQPLQHTSTFGIRVYRNGSMLINHIDRADTHLASAVIQISQEVEEGWPLEVLDAQGNCYEVYLQPGELVLYEGARFHHGRPMRLNGSEFANVFSHFRPLDWRGPDKSPQYDGLLNQEGYRTTMSSSSSSQENAEL